MQRKHDVTLPYFQGKKCILKHCVGMNKRQEMPKQPEPPAYPVHSSWSELEKLSALALCAQTCQL